MAKDKQVVMAQYQYQGPIPSSAEMSRYSQIDPSLPSRIMGMAEEQSAHRQNLESKHLGLSHKRSICGMFCAFIIVMSAIVGGTLCILQGKEAVGISAILAAIVPIVGAFIYSTISNSRERKRKWEEVKK